METGRPGGQLAAMLLFCGLELCFCCCHLHVESFCVLLFVFLLLLLLGYLFRFYHYFYSPTFFYDRYNIPHNAKSLVSHLYPLALPQKKKRVNNAASRVDDILCWCILILGRKIVKIKERVSPSRRDYG